MISVTEQSTSEREQEIIDLFNQIRPLLDEGHSYASALKTIDPSLNRSRQCKKIKDYGETQGYSRNTYSRRAQYLSKNPIKRKDKNKYGLLNVTLVKKPAYLSGHAWMYKYHEDDTVKTLSRSDLRELRKVVEEKNLEWKVTDLEKARDSYNLNTFILENARSSRNRNASGIFRVHKSSCHGCVQGFSWIYCNVSEGKNVYLSSVDLNKLVMKVLEAGEDLIILDEEKAKANGLKI